MAGTCERDYTATPCPYGYVPQDISYNEFHEAAGITCAADLLYEGSCEQLVIFQDAQEKRDFAEQCQTSWPCQRVCRDALAACPNGWQSVGEGLCMAPDFYKARGCPLLQSFHSWTNAMKKTFAQSCGAEWLCAEDVEEGAAAAAEPSNGPRVPMYADGDHAGPIAELGNVAGA